MRTPAARDSWWRSGGSGAASGGGHGGGRGFWFELLILMSLGAVSYSASRSTANLSDANLSSPPGKARCAPSPRPTARPNTYYLGFLQHSKLYPLYHVGALTLAVEQVNKELKDIGVTLDYYWNKTDGSKVKSIQLMTELREKGVHGFIGPSHTACLTEATVATAWNIPLISYHCQDKIVGVVDAVPTFVRTFPPKMKVVEYITKIMSNYQWTRTVIFYGSSAPDQKEPSKLSPWLETVETLKKTKSLNIVDTKVMPISYFSQMDRAGLERMFDETKLETRTYIFLGDHGALVDFVRYKHQTLSAEGIEDEYVILAVTEKKQAPKDDGIDTFLKFEEFGKVNITKEHIIPFRNVLLLCFRAPADETKYRNFMEASCNKSIDVFDVFNIYDYKKYKFRGLMPEASYLYDAVYLYGRTLKEALTNNSVDVNNGSSMIELMKDRPYDSIEGYSIHIDSTGDSMANYSVYSVPKDELKMLKVANFKMSANNSPLYSTEIGEDKIWINQAPRNVPVCGYDRSLCVPMDWKLPFLSSIGALIAVATVAVVFLCRHYRYEQKLASLLWKLDIKDLIFTDTDFNDPMLSDKPKRRTSTRQSVSVEADDNQKNDACAAKFSGIRVATFRGSLVAVRFLKRRHVEVTRTMRKELQLLKEFQHDNINRFIGACIDTPNICIVTQYCSRGSLKDLLENDDLHLDDMFIASLVFDLIRGMIFLHDSEIGSHGNLKSTNCLVDSRWVLQIADFGIHHLRGCELPSMVDEETYYGRLLWRAPELLRMLVPPPGGTQRADVYSFGIILFEIHGRAGPWGPTMYSAREIVEKVKYPPDGAILRPDTSLLKCEWEFVVRCMRECWREIPDCRPDFKYIRMKLKPMQRGLKPNIFDNMLAIMEKYAHNLEATVAARTDQLVEEKKKTEALLLRMLPKFVAEQLKIGNPVVPEHFNSVTIYFSDVVGFTAISAESTPLEVVDMLNDMYTCFDSIIGEYDVYKVETIGDAYMVVSGLPIKNGDNHAGSVVSGVVGLKMPRYCLFGDTVNTASRMESNGEPMKIHCSDSTKALLTKLGGYILDERGLIPIKGKGKMFTYFLAGEDKSHRLRRISVEKRPLSLDSSAFHNLTPLPAHGRLGGSTMSLRSEDSASAAAESLRHLLNGNVPLLRDELGSSLESQV